MTGDKLDSAGSAIAVDTGIGSRKPSVLGRLFGSKPTPGVVVYVCCQDCAAKVKSNPAPYVTRVIGEVSGWSQDGVGSTGSSRVTRR